MYGWELGTQYILLLQDLFSPSSWAVSEIMSLEIISARSQLPDSFYFAPRLSKHEMQIPSSSFLFSVKKKRKKKKKEGEGGFPNLRKTFLGLGATVIYPTEHSTIVLGPQCRRSKFLNYFKFADRSILNCELCYVSSGIAPIIFFFSSSRSLDIRPGSSRIVFPMNFASKCRTDFRN